MRLPKGITPLPIFANLFSQPQQPSSASSSASHVTDVPDQDQFVDFITLCEAVYTAQPDEISKSILLTDAPHDQVAQYIGTSSEQKEFYDFEKYYLKYAKFAKPYLRQALESLGFGTDTDITDPTYPKKLIWAMAFKMSQQALIASDAWDPATLLAFESNKKLAVNGANEDLLQAYCTYDPSVTQAITLKGALQITVHANAEQLKSKTESIETSLKPLQVKHALKLKQIQKIRDDVSTNAPIKEWKIGRFTVWASKKRLLSKETLDVPANSLGLAASLQSEAAQLEKEINFYEGKLRIIRYTQRATPYLNSFIKAYTEATTFAEKNELSFLEQAWRFIKLPFSVFDSEQEVHFPEGIPESDKKIIILTAAQKVLDNKLYQLVHDPRTTSNIDDEIKKTAAELNEVKADINKLLNLKVGKLADQGQKVVVAESKEMGITAAKDPAQTPIGFQNQWVEAKEQQYQNELNHHARVALGHFEDEPSLYTRFKRATIFEIKPVLAFKRLEMNAFPIVLDVALARLQASNTAEAAKINAIQDEELRLSLLQALHDTNEADQKNLTALKEECTQLTAAAKEIFDSDAAGPISFNGQYAIVIRNLIKEALNIKYENSGTDAQIRSVLQKAPAELQEAVYKKLAEHMHEQIKTLQVGNGDDDEATKVRIAAAEIEYFNACNDLERKGLANLRKNWFGQRRSIHFFNTLKEVGFEELSPADRAIELGVWYKKNFSSAKILELVDAAKAQRNTSFQQEFAEESVMLDAGSDDEGNAGIPSGIKFSPEFARVYKQQETRVRSLKDILENGDIPRALLRAMQFELNGSNDIAIHFAGQGEDNKRLLAKFINQYDASNITLTDASDELNALKNLLADREGKSIYFGALDPKLQAQLYEKAKAGLSEASGNIRQALIVEYNIQVKNLQDLQRNENYLDFQQRRSIDDNNRKARALHQSLLDKSSSDEAQDNYTLSRWGKFTGVLYVVSQVVGLGFMGLLMILAISTNIAVWGWLLIPLALFMAATGYSNWWVFRTNTPGLFITLRNMFNSPNDVPLTFTQKLKLSIALFVCFVSGFIGGYIFFMLTWTGAATLLEILGWTATFAVLAPALPYVIIPIMVIIAAGAAVALTVIFFKSFYGTILREEMWADISSYFSALFMNDKDDPGEIDRTLEAEKQKLRDRYQYYYTDQKVLEKKIKDQVEGSVVGILLAKNRAQAEKGEYGRIRTRAFILCLLVPVLVIGIIIGAVFAQLAGHPDLRAVIEAHLYVGFAIADGISWFLCACAGVAYLDLFSRGATICATEIACGVVKTEGNNKTIGSMWFFQGVRGGNTTENAAQTLYGFCKGFAKEKVVNFAAAMKDVLAASWDTLLLCFGSVGFSAIGSFITNSIQGAKSIYDAIRDRARAAFVSSGRINKHILADTAAARELQPMVDKPEVLAASSTATAEIVMPVKPVAEIEGWATPEESTASKCYNSLRAQWRNATGSSSAASSTVHTVDITSRSSNAFFVTK